ncbi:MAG: DUF6671 family protein [Bacillota bacterium]
MAGSNTFFQGRYAVLLTKHRKEQVIKPTLEKAVGVNVIVETGFDTDRLGTFTREIERPGSQLDTARLKARKGMELTGLDIGLASEGSFGSHPVMLWVPWNVEIVLLLDKKANLEIYGEYAGFNTNYAHEIVSSFTEAENFARKVGFPEHWLVLRPDNERHQSIVKDINDWEHLKEAVAWGVARSIAGKVFLETDMRAHANPTRMGNIQKATENLVEKINRQCPRCGTPGFSVTKTKKGLPCEWCGGPTEEIMAVVFTCARCAFSQEEVKGPEERAPAGRCPYCNP